MYVQPLVAHELKIYHLFIDVILTPHSPHWGSDSISKTSWNLFKWYFEYDILRYLPNSKVPNGQVVAVLAKMDFSPDITRLSLSLAMPFNEV